MKRKRSSDLCSDCEVLPNDGVICDRIEGECGAHYGTGSGSAICRRTLHHPPIALDGIGHSPTALTGNPPTDGG